VNAALGKEKPWTYLVLRKDVFVDGGPCSQLFYTLNGAQHLFVRFAFLYGCVRFRDKNS
jgi:hypothetical protein